jgi:hypothetical protein
MRGDIRKNFYKLSWVLRDINEYAPSTEPGRQRFRAECAGLLSVHVAASYENCVKDTLQSYSAHYHSAFSDYTLRNFEKLNSKIRFSDLCNYCCLFDQKINVYFKKTISEKRTKFRKKTGIDILDSYENLLSWRHSFAHTGASNPTVTEVASAHRAGKLIILTFDDAFRVGARPK